jgi:hypothetical protein
LAANFIQNLYTVLKKRLWESRSTPTDDSSLKLHYGSMQLQVSIRIVIGRMLSCNLGHKMGPENNQKPYLVFLNCTVFLFAGYTFQILITWPDGHESRYKTAFFEKYGCPDGKSGDLTGFSDRSDPILWDFEHKLRKHCFDNITNSDSSLFDWLYGL